MIGNDVIDLRQTRIESNWMRKGFIQKVFTDQEQFLIANHPNPEIAVWTLWSMKEAAYKIWNRETKIRAYIPNKLHCSLLTQNSTDITGQVHYGSCTYYTKTIISKEHIHTIAVNFLNDLEHIIEIEKKEILKDKYGIPYLPTIADELKYDKAVSISNHGQFEKVVTIKK